jgi:haloalkane dehalogenase
MAIGRLMKRSCPHLTDAECAAYDAPFLNINYKAGVRLFPKLVPIHSNDPGADISQKAREWLGNKWAGETFIVVGKQDPVLGPSVMSHLSTLIKNCHESFIIEEVGHFVQEWGDKVAKKALEIFKLN